MKKSCKKHTKEKVKKLSSFLLSFLETFTMYRISRIIMAIQSIIYEKYMRKKTIEITAIYSRRSIKKI